MLTSFVLCGCHTYSTVSRRSPPPAPSTAQPAPPPPVAPAQPAGLYTTEAALRDALSGPLEHVGTGTWPGTNRTQACVFRNLRVFVVNVYCTTNETQAFRVDVYSPERGRVRVYAEASGPISSRTRQDYFTFTAESEPPAGPQVPLRSLSLQMSFEELRSYEQARYDAYLPVCYGGLQLSRERGRCLGELEGQTDAWLAQHRAFLRYASDDWYTVLRQLRGLAQHHGTRLQ